MEACKRLAVGFKRGLVPDSKPATTEAGGSRAPSRGQALREAHRTLRLRLYSHPALRRMMPHLAYIEKSLAKHGSSALSRVPVEVLQRGLAQLSVLQPEDEPVQEATNLRVLRLRLIEAIAMRVSKHPQDARPLRGAAEKPEHATEGLPAMEVQEVSVSEFDEVERSLRMPLDSGSNSRWHDTH
jgi:hypothetical protein